MGLAQHGKSSYKLHSDWREQPQAPLPLPSPNKSQRLPYRPPAPRIESQGIRVNAGGTVHLVATLSGLAQSIATPPNLASARSSSGGKLSGRMD
ncbi:MAG: hypothetical protein HC771_21805 [Synechococcales cyanobacterium CRU_2_2]|nr:hypothetical protein [Synechococcales cyanobacterium CRU_2_2]